MADHPTIGVDDHGAAEVVKGEMMTAAQFYPPVFQKLSEFPVCDEFLLHSSISMLVF